jgi:hypothetical protein
LHFNSVFGFEFGFCGSDETQIETQKQN